VNDMKKKTFFIGFLGAYLMFSVFVSLQLTMIFYDLWRNRVLTFIEPNPHIAFIEMLLFGFLGILGLIAILVFMHLDES